MGRGRGRGRGMGRGRGEVGRVGKGRRVGEKGDG